MAESLLRMGWGMATGSYRAAGVERLGVILIRKRRCWASPSVMTAPRGGVRDCWRV